MSRTLSRRSVLRSAGTVAAGAAVATAVPIPAYSTETVAARARSVPRFLSSLGVCAHIGQGVDDAAGAGGVLPYLGVYNVRDDSNLDAVQKWIDLHRISGAKIDLIAQSNSVTDTMQIAGQLAAAGALLSVEGPNEPNNQPVTYNGQTSDRTTTFLPVAEYVRDLYGRVARDQSLRGIPVFASSEAGGSEPNNVGLQFLTIPPNADTLMPAGTRFADYANTHTYPQRSPGWVDNLAWNVADPTLNGAWDGLYVEFGHTWYGGFAGYSKGQLANLPRVMTETGWATQGSGSISEDRQGRLIMCLYLANFTREWTNTFIYMLRDDPVQGYWGLVDTGYNPKLSGTYLHNLTTILHDDRNAPIRSPARLAYLIRDKPPTVHDVFLQKSNGDTYLVVWNEQADSSNTITVTIDGPPPTMQVYNPTVGTSPIQTLSGSRTVTLTMDGYDCRIIKL